MLKLKNIKKTNTVISAEYDPENSGALGKIAIDLSSGAVLEKHLSKHDMTFPIYFNHALEGLKKLGKTEHCPDEKTIMWY